MSLVRFLMKTFQRPSPAISLRAGVLIIACLLLSSGVRAEVDSGAPCRHLNTATVGMTGSKVAASTTESDDGLLSDRLACFQNIVFTESGDDDPCDLTDPDDADDCGNCNKAKRTHKVLGILPSGLSGELPADQTAGCRLILGAPVTRTVFLPEKVRQFQHSRRPAASSRGGVFRKA